MSRPSELMSRTLLKRYRNAGMLPIRDEMGLTDYHSVGGLLHTIREHSAKVLAKEYIKDSTDDKEMYNEVYEQYYHMSLDDLEIEMNMLKLKGGYDTHEVL